MCDCCDGSDEWRGHTLSEENKLPKQGPNVHFAPCRDICYDYELQQAAKLDMLKQGQELKVLCVYFRGQVFFNTSPFCKHCTRIISETVIFLVIDFRKLPDGLLVIDF